MMLGMSLETFTWFHTALSLVALVAGFVVVYGLIAGQQYNGWIALFLATLFLTSATGFGFPFNGFLPSHGVGIISLALLVFTVLAFYAFHLQGPWRWIFAVTAVIGLYLNVFVAIVQAFLKIPALNALAPTQSEPPFLIAQGLALAIFAVLTILAAIKFHPVTTTAAPQH